ncbi:MAG: translocation/assembly module TamB domain-containing protein [Dokdonella sp.]
MKRWLKTATLALLALLLVTGLGSVWLLNSEGGARFVLARVQGTLDGKLTIERSSGSLSGPLVLDGVRWRDTAAGIDAFIKRASVDLTLNALLRQRVQIDEVDIDDVEIALTTLQPVAGEAAGAFSLDAPIDIAIGKLVVQRANITQDGEPLFAADRLDLVGAWTRSGIIVKQFALQAPDGRVDLVGTLATAGGYSGNGETTFRWRVGEVEYAGTLRSRSDGREVAIEVALTEPIISTVNATIGQSAPMPWTLRLEAPSFAVERIAADTGIETLALSLQGSGERAGGALRGEVTVDGRRVVLDAARYALADDILTLEALSLKSPDIAGVLNAVGTVRYAESPPGATLTIDWEGVELPADLVGQALATRGKLDVAGNVEAFTANGALSIGPPGQPSDLRVALTGTPEQIALETLALVQANGGLDARGTITLQPTIGWVLDATAKSFNPGAFAAGWSGVLDFALNTTGKLTDRGPDATITLERLSGLLRERKLSGKADLVIKPGYIVDGTVDLASGDSTIALIGRGGNQTDLRAQFNVASLGDWLPDAGGSADGNVRVFGKWPALDIEADARAKDLNHAGTRVTSLELAASARDIQKLAGAVTLKAIGVSSGEANFDTLTIEANGNQAAHQLSINAIGTPASIELALSGSARDGKWQGTLRSFGIDPSQRNLQNFDLAAPAQLGWEGARFTLSESCLVGRAAARGTRVGGETDAATTTADVTQIAAEARNPARLCVGGESSTDGSVAGRYTLEHLPLRLVMRLAAPESPVRLRGEINGQGDIQRSADGTLRGNATLTSSEGRALYTGGGNEPVLSYRDFVLDARFAPQSSTANVRAALDNDGRLSGQVMLTRMADGEQALDGTLDLAINSLAFLELITPEVANTKGRLAANYTIGGTLAAPRLNGALILSDFATEVPVAGLKLRDGAITLRAGDAQRFVLEGSIASGTGTLVINGEGGLDAADPLKVSLKGENVTAADIPAARVVISPDLVIDRGESGFIVTGKVVVPSANVDFSRLPGGGVARTSPDVVIVDAKREERGKSVPVTATVAVELGDKVKLAGFGFDGNVAGNLVVYERPGRATTATGTLNVGGTYKAYGQDLNIETGRVLFAGTAIDNPGIDIRAVRKIEADDVTAGLLVRGTAQVPVLTVFGEPAMEQSNALSYLITGKPLSSLKSGEGDMLGTAARALGTAGGDLLAKSIGGRLGVDDIGVADNATLGGAAFTVGKYLSPKLYLSYGVGIFEPGEIVTLRYLFHKRWNFEAQNATTGSRAGVNYRYER